MNTGKYGEQTFIYAVAYRIDYRIDGHVQSHIVHDYESPRLVSILIDWFAKSPYVLPVVNVHVDSVRASRTCFSHNGWRTRL
jgi:hypothetical protein